jgi:acyl carrier protein
MGDLDDYREGFFADVTALLRELKPDAPWERLLPDTHLWVEGYLDSIGLLEVIYLLEERLGRAIELTGEFLPNFYTLQALYQAYAEPALHGTEQG